MPWVESLRASIDKTMRNWYSGGMDKFEYIGLPPGEERSKLYLERMHDLSAQIIINDTGNLNGPSNQHICTVIERSDSPAPKTSHTLSL